MNSNWNKKLHECLYCLLNFSKSAFHYRLNDVFVPGNRNAVIFYDFLQNFHTISVVYKAFGNFFAIVCCQNCWYIVAIDWLHFIYFIYFLYTYAYIFSFLLLSWRAKENLLILGVKTAHFITENLLLYCFDLILILTIRSYLKLTFARVFQLIPYSLVLTMSALLRK